MKKLKTTLSKLLSASLAFSICLTGAAAVESASANSTALSTQYEIVQTLGWYKIVKYQGKFGVIYDGKTVIPCVYDEVIRTNYESGKKFIVRKDDVYALYDTSEQTTTCTFPNYPYQLYYIADMAGFVGVHSYTVPYYCTNSNGSLQFWTSTGEPLISDSSLHPIGFVSEGGCLIVQDTQTGLYGVWSLYGDESEQTNRLTVPCIYPAIQLVPMPYKGISFSSPSTYALIPAEDGKWTIINAYNGNSILSGTYDKATTYAGCLAVNRDGQTSYYDALNSKWVQPQPSLYNSEQISAWAKDEVGKAAMAELVESDLQEQYTQPCTRKDFCHLIAAAAKKCTERNVQEMCIEQERVPGFFSDTEDIDVLACAALGIVNGVGNGKFAPDKAIKREEAAAMLYRAAKVLGITENSERLTFVDERDISDWAKDAVAAVSAMQTADGTMVMQGTGNRMFSPRGTYTREQSILTVYRLYRMK